MSSVDQTGKVAGKRILTDDGTWVAVKNLPQDIQAEMLRNTKQADQDRMKKALSNNKEYADTQATKTESALRAENQEFKALLAKQGEMLATLNAKMQLGAVPTRMVTPDELPTPKPKKPTKKQSIQMECEEKGIEFEEEDTIAELQGKLAEYEIDSLDEA